MLPDSVGAQLPQRSTQVSSSPHRDTSATVWRLWQHSTLSHSVMMEFRDQKNIYGLWF